MTAEIRSPEATGTKHTRRLRASGFVPAIVYGLGKKNESIAIPEKQIDGLIRKHAHGLIRLNVEGGKAQNIIIKSVQWDSVTDRVLHVDLIRVAKGEKVTVEIPVSLVGEAPGLKEGGVLEKYVDEIAIDCPAENIPEVLEISVDDLHLDGTITYRDISLPDGCEFHFEHHESDDEEGAADPLDQPVLAIKLPQADEEESSDDQASGAESAGENE